MLLRSLGALFFWWVAVSQPTPPLGPVPSDPSRLVRDAVQNELRALENDPTRWMYRLHKEKERYTLDTEIVETGDGALSRTLLFNGQPLTADQRAQDEERMRRIAGDPAEQARRERRAKEDKEKVRQLLRPIPDAFLFQYAGMEDGLARLTFQPNPRYSPSTREARVYQAMSGSLWIDPSALRLVKIESQLFADVTFGAGLLGRLEKGGTLKLVQKDVGDHHWLPVELDLEMRGHVVLFKTLSIQQKQSLTDFHRVPAGLTMAQGLEMLLHSGDGAATAQNQVSK